MTNRPTLSMIRTVTTTVATTDAGHPGEHATEVLLSVEQLAAACAIEPEWVIERVRAGLIDGLLQDDPADGDPARWRFHDAHLVRVRCMVSMERQMDANPELAALVADLIDEVQALRRELRGAGRSEGSVGSG